MFLNAVSASHLNQLDCQSSQILKYFGNAFFKRRATRSTEFQSVFSSKCSPAIWYLRNHKNSPTATLATICGWATEQSTSYSTRTSPSYCPPPPLRTIKKITGTASLMIWMISFSRLSWVLFFIFFYWLSAALLFYLTKKLVWVRSFRFFSTSQTFSIYQTESSLI